MSTPQRSRYPRPLKATHTFPGGSGGAGQSQGMPPNQLASGSGSPSSSSAAPSSSSTTTAAGHGQTAALKNGHNSPPPAASNGVRRCVSSPECKSLVVCNRGEKQLYLARDGRGVSGSSSHTCYVGRGIGSRSLLGLARQR